VLRIGEASPGVGDKRAAMIDGDRPLVVRSRSVADHVLESRVWVARPRCEVFAFFADSRNLLRLTPRSYRLKIVSAPAILVAGAVLDLRLAWLGVPVRCRVFIREWDPPFRFVDVQVRGPWARWEHRHRFLEEAGGTWIEDRVTYRLPLGPVGRAVHCALVGRGLRGLWAYRTARLDRLLGPVGSPAC